MNRQLRRIPFSLVYIVMAIMFETYGGTALAQDQEVLENGLVRLVFDRHTGLFEAQSIPPGTVQLFAAGPAFQKDGRIVSAADATKVETRRESFEDQIGPGEKLIVEYSFQGGIPGFRYELSLYKDRPSVSATAYLPRGDYQLGDFDVVRGKVQASEASKTRLYVSSGTAGGDSGVWELGLRRWSSAALSVYYDPKIQEALSLGFYSFYRASTSVVSQYLAANEIGARAAAHYNSYRPQDGDLKTESLLISFGRDPLRILEEWAEATLTVVHPKFLHDTQTGFMNTWYMYGDEISEEETLKQARMLRESILPGYGIKIVDTGEWQVQRHAFGDGGNALGYGEDQEDRRLYPHGVKWLSEQLHGLGFQTTFGANYAYAASESSIAKKNVAWLVKEDRSRMSFGYPIDFTHPGARKWLYDLAHRAVEYQAVEWWTDFDGGPTRGKLYDPKKIMEFEDIREGMKATRESIGPGVLVHRYCCGPYFTYLGLADRVRTGDDTHPLGDFQGLKAMARQLAATYMLHQRFWINDPDPVFVGGRGFVNNPGTGPIGPDSSLLDEVRMRLQHQLATGGFVTIGENLEDLNPERIRLLTLVLPPYGQAARPLDLFMRTTPEIYDLKVKTDWDEWQVLLLQNWNDWDKDYDIHFSDLGLDPKKSYLVFRFWNQAFLGQFRGNVSLKVGSRTGESYAIRELPQHPWLLSTDMHLTQGGVELQDVRYDESSGQLAGVARRHPGAQGLVVAYVPPGYKILTASGPYGLDTQPSGAVVAHLQLKFDGATSPWSLSFEMPK